LGCQSANVLLFVAGIHQRQSGNSIREYFYFWIFKYFLKRAEKFRPQLARLYPRIKQLYLWLRKSQNGSLPGTFRWHDRNATTDLEVNPGESHFEYLEYSN
jgi:hypothetical protein